MSEMHVVYAVDDNYAQHMGVSLLSLLENNHSYGQVIAHVLDCGIQDENRYKLLELEQQYANLSLNYYPLLTQLDTVTWHGKNQSLPYLSKASMARILIPSTLPQSLSKVLYLDADTVVLKDVSDFYHSDLSEKYAAVIEDVTSKEHKAYLAVQGFDVKKPYFNSGVMLINLKQCRKDHIEQKCLDSNQNISTLQGFPDQDILNMAMQEHLCYMHPKYNVTLLFKNGFRLNFLKTFSKRVFQEGYNNPYIWHYVSSSKPWNTREAVRAKYYLKYLAMSPWSENKPPHISLIRYCYLFQKKCFRYMRHVRYRIFST